MKKITFALIYIVIAITVLTSSGCSGKNSTNNYRVFVGTNDKDTNKLEIPLEDQKDILLKIIIKYVDGVTIYNSDGYWKNDNGEICIEKTFVCDFLDISKDSLEKICDEALVALNQNSILYEKNNCTINFYSRK